MLQYYHSLSKILFAFCSILILDYLHFYLLFFNCLYGIIPNLVFPSSDLWAVPVLDFLCLEYKTEKFVYHVESLMYIFQYGCLLVHNKNICLKLLSYRL